MSHKTRTLGDRGERFVADFLAKDGYSILASNERWLGGEIDLIVSRGDVIAFVEVKTRTQASQFPLSNVVTIGKQRKIIKTALRFIALRNLHNVALRFDVCLVTLRADKDFDINYIPNAFTAPEVF